MNKEQATEKRVPARAHSVTVENRSAVKLTGVTDVAQSEAPRQEHGFVLVWPAAGETRWDTARRLRVPQEALKPAGSDALLAFRK